MGKNGAENRKSFYIFAIVSESQRVYVGGVFIIVIVAFYKMEKTCFSVMSSEFFVCNEIKKFCLL
jgi:hypothetical protein